MGAFLPGFLWPVIVICLLHSPYLVYLGIPPCGHLHLFTKMDSRNIAWHDSPLASREPFLPTCGQGGLLISGTRNVCSVQDPASSLYSPAFCLGISISREWISNYFTLGWAVVGSPICLLPHDQGLNPGPRQWKHRVLTSGPSGNSPSPWLF